MLKRLNLQNLVLIESAEIEFAAGLSILTGETGAGKTAIISALSLILGQRANCDIIRKGAERAFVEATFEIEGQSNLRKALEEAEIEYLPEEKLVIRREISKEGRSRAFVNHQMVSLPLLQKISSCLIDLIDQHSHQDLRSHETQRDLLDLWGSLEEEIASFAQYLTEEKDTKERLNTLLKENLHRERDLDLYSYEFKEIEEANIQEGEEEKTFQQYQKLANLQELTEKLSFIYKGLSDSPNALIPLLVRYKGSCDSLSQLDQKLEEPAELLNEALIALNETSATLEAYLDQLEADPKNFVLLEQRLNIINKIKRKYGPSFEEIHKNKERLKEKLQKLETIDDKIEQTRQQLYVAEHKASEFAALLTKKRKSSAHSFAKILTESLRSLNMPHAEVIIDIKPSIRSSFGEDLVSFWLRSNVGEEPSSVRENSSGGELARLLLAIKTTFSEKNNTSTIIFDEIDANVGGETATLIGEKLNALGKVRQIICITHFPQVACKADHHLHVFKSEIDGRTITTVKNLDKKEKEKELLRMLGGKKIGSLD